MTSCVRCARCKAVYLIPYGPPALDGYYSRRALEWLREHPCRLLDGV